MIETSPQPGMRIALAVSALLLLPVSARALDLSANPERSFFIGVGMGAHLDLEREARSPRDLAGEHPEAYSLGAFLFGIHGGYRFDELVALELGWQQARHDADPDWGGFALYQLGHVVLRLAVATPTRETIVFSLGPALGGFYYGAATPGMEEDNGAFVLGGLAGVTLEHEFTLGVVGAVRLAYLPLYRFGMGQLGLQETYLIEGSEVTELVDTKDFSDGRLLHVLWVTAAVQFEWTFR
jgi:hypothetical protein